MPRDATNTPASHTSALGGLFIADECGGVQAEIYKVGSGAVRVVSHLRSPHTGRCGEVMISCCGVLDVAALAGVGWRCSDLQRPPVVWLRGRSPSDNSELAGAQVSSYLQYLDCFRCRNSGLETLSWGRKRITRSIRFSKSTLHF